MERHYRLERGMLYCGLTKEDFGRVQGEIVRSNYNNLILFTRISAAFMAALFVLSFVPATDLAVNRYLYLGIFLAVMAIHDLSHRMAKNDTTITILMYIFIGAFYLFGIIMGTYLGPDKRAVTCIVMLFAGPILFTDRPARMCAFLASAVAVFLTLVVKFKNPAIWSSDITNALCYGLFSCLTTMHLARVKAERYLYELKTVDAYEQDMLTGVRNRNSYEHSVHKYLEDCQTAAIFVYFDVNGLHEVNNTQGHAAGDAMLRVCAQQIAKVFGNENTYRVGGDEFIAITMDKIDADIDAMLEEIFAGVKRENYHVSTGYAHCYKNGVIEDSVKEAEQFMFKNKAAYYSSKLHDRRQR